jgi:23S rRNA (adenine2503-C2)-methyltransferase
MPEPGELQMVAPRRRKPPVHLSDLTVAQRRDVVKALDLPGFRADQVSKQWFSRLADDPATWTDVPEAMRASLGEALTPALLDEVRRMQADDGLTVKSLWRLFDGALVESVLMRYPATERSRARTTVCISSQAGCGMNCPFCATGQAGLTRNLSTGEIVEQVVAAARLLDRGEAEGGKGRVGNIVFMGMGEPLANYDAVIGAVRRLAAESPEGLGLSARNITVSTVGLVPRIQQLATEGIPVTLAVSLHAPDDELRDTLVPINTRFKVDEVLDAAWNYAHVTRRRVSIEYALIRDVNDQAERADLLGKLLKGRLVHVNLIPLNPTPGSKWTASRRKDEAEFVRRLQSHGVAVTVRDTRGRDIDGACGQLAAAE